MLSWHNVNVSLGHLTLTQTMLYLKECFRVNMKMHEYPFHSQIFFVIDLWGTRFISVGRQWGQTVQQIYKTTHRDLQDTCCCLLQPCYSSWTNIKLMSWALQSQQTHFCCTKQFQPLTSGIISVPVKLSPWVQSTVLQNAMVMMFCERLGTRIGKYHCPFCV